MTEAMKRILVLAFFLVTTFALAEPAPFPGVGAVTIPIGSGFETSGAYFNPYNEDLWIVDDGGQVKLIHGLVTVDTWNLGGDLEGIVVPNPEDEPNIIMVIKERTPEQIREYDMSTNPAQAKRTFDLTPWYGGYDNDGPEAIAIEKHTCYEPSCENCHLYSVFIAGQLDNFIRWGSIDVEDCDPTYEFDLPYTIYPCYEGLCENSDYISDMVVTNSSWGEPMLWVLYGDHANVIRILNTDGDWYADYYGTDSRNEALGVDFYGCKVWIGSDFGANGDLKRYIFPTTYMGCQFLNQD